MSIFQSWNTNEESNCNGIFNSVLISSYQGLEVYHLYAYNFIFLFFFLSLLWPTSNLNNQLYFSESKVVCKWITCNFQVFYEFVLTQVTHKNYFDFKKENPLMHLTLFLLSYFSIKKIFKWNPWIAVFLIKLRLLFFWSSLCLAGFLRSHWSCFMSICIVMANPLC